MPSAAAESEEIMNTLLKKAKRRDAQAFVALMQENTKDMYKVAIAILSNDEDAADAIQDTILACWEKLTTLKQDEFFKSWLTRILINKCNSILRKRRKLVPDDSMMDMQAGCECPGYQNAEWNEMLRCVDEKYRVILVLYYAEGFKIKEISEILRESESAIKRRLVEARKQMEQAYYPEKGRKRR